MADVERIIVEAPHRFVLGSRVYDELQGGQSVNIAAFGNIYVEMDEENLGLERVTLGNLQKGWEAQGGEFTKGLHQSGIEVDPFTAYKWYQIQRKVVQTLGPPSQDIARQREQRNNHRVRFKLSEARGQAVCAEYATLSALIAQKIGEPAHLVIGSVVNEDDLDGWRAAHAFVWLDGLNAVFDSVQAQTDNEYPAIMLPKTPVNFDALEAGKDIAGQRLGTDFTLHYGLQAGGFGIDSAHQNPPSLKELS
jgi:hypothetical protein